MYTMDHEVGPWKDGLFQWSKFMVRLLKKLDFKALGPSLGVNRVLIKKNDQAPKNDCVDFLAHAQKWQFWEKN